MTLGQTLYGRVSLESDDTHSLSLAPGHLPGTQKEGRCVFYINYCRLSQSRHKELLLLLLLLGMAVLQLR